MLKLTELFPFSAIHIRYPFLGWQLLVCLLLAACGSPSAPPLPVAVVDTGTLPEWETRWLRGVPCWAPCWEGVAPGTSASTAIAQWRQSEVIRDFSFERTGYRPLGPGLTSIFLWHTFDDGRGVAWSSPATDLILGIDPGIQSCIAFTYVQEAFGDPTHVVARTWEAGQAYYHVTLVYLPYGLDVEVLEAGPQTLDVAHPLCVSPRFFEPGTRGFTAYYRGRPPQLVAWQGLQGFAFYCRTERGERCVQNP